MKDVISMKELLPGGNEVEHCPNEVYMRDWYTVFVQIQSVGSRLRNSEKQNRRVRSDDVAAQPGGMDSRTRNCLHAAYVSHQHSSQSGKSDYL